MAKERTRKEYKHGTTTQKMWAFRLDDENQEWLQKQPNKGRAVNELIKTAREQEGESPAEVIAASLAAIREAAARIEAATRS